MLKQHELQSLVHTFGKILKYISMKFGMDKYSTVRIKKRKICDVVDVEMPDEPQMKQIEESDSKFLGIIQNSEIETQIMKDKIRT